MGEEIVNKVANSSLIQIDLEDFLPNEEIVEIDLAMNLFQGFVLREKDFRDFIKITDWSTYSKKAVAVNCTADAIIPNWAYMLLTSVLIEHGAEVLFGSVDQVKEALLLKNFKNSGIEKYTDKKILVKGCGSFDLTPKAFVEVTSALQKNVQSLMFGEACSSVPVFKKRRH